MHPTRSERRREAASGCCVALQSGLCTRASPRYSSCVHDRDTSGSKAQHAASMIVGWAVMNLSQQRGNDAQFVKRAGWRAGCIVALSSTASSASASASLCFSVAPAVGSALDVFGFGNRKKNLARAALKIGTDHRQKVSAMQLIAAREDEGGRRTLLARLLIACASAALCFAAHFALSDNSALSRLHTLESNRLERPWRKQPRPGYDAWSTRW